MDYVGLIVLILGLICVIISVKYIDNYDNIKTILEKNCNKKIKTRFPEIIVEIQDKLDIDDYNLNKKINLNKEKISKIINSKNVEKFSNYIPYKSFNNRKGINHSISGLIRPQKREKQISQFKFIDKINLAKKAILYQQDYKIFPKYNLFNKNNKKFISRPLCMVRNENKTYCYPTYEKEFCTGIYGKNFNECKDYLKDK